MKKYLYKIKTDLQYLIVDIPIIQYNRLFAFDFSENLLNVKTIGELEEILKDKTNNKWKELKKLLLSIILDIWSGPDYSNITEEQLINDMKVDILGSCIYCKEK